jgi:pilus assembly protein CpaC
MRGDCARRRGGLRSRFRRGPIRTALLLLAAPLTLAAGVRAEDAPPVVRQPVVPTPERAIVSLSSGAAREGRLLHLELERGKSAVLQTEFRVKRVSIGDPEIVDVVVLDPRQAHLVAKAIGDTNVVLWNADGKLEAALDVHVGSPHSQIETELRRVLHNDTIGVDGAGHALVVRGSVASPTQMERAVQVADAFFGRGRDEPSQVINMLEVGGNQQVMISIIIAEMKRTLGRELGTNWSGVHKSGDTTVDFASLLDDVFLRANFVLALMEGSDSLNVFIEALQENGLAKILAEPSLVARSGAPAQFLVGGEVPIPIPQSALSDSITVEFKPFGVGVIFTPTVMGPDRIHLDVATEVSLPVEAFGVEITGFSIPSFEVRKVSTGVDLGDGESFAIAGLLREDIDETINQFPLLGDLPILGVLFRSTSFQKQETELVMIVTPHLVKPLPPGPPPLPTDNFVEPNAAEFFLLGSLEGRYGKETKTDEPSPEASAPIPIPIPEPEPEAELDDRGAGEFGHRIAVPDAEEESQ